MTNKTKAGLDAKALEVAREAIARKKDEDNAPNSARLIREGKWDDASEVRDAYCGAFAALSSQHAEAAPVAWSLVWGERYGVNAETTFKTEEQAQSYAAKCSAPRPRVVPLYASPVPADAEPVAWRCAARHQGTAGGNDPADCNWPVCGCDPYAGKVIAALEEAGSSLVTADEGWPGIKADEIAEEARRYAGFYPEASDGRNTFIIFAEWIERRSAVPTTSPAKGGAEVTEALKRASTTVKRYIRAGYGDDVFMADLCETDRAIDAALRTSAPVDKEQANEGGE